jgi:hypothetical protein
LVILLALGIGLPPVWAEEGRLTISTIDFYGLRTVTGQQMAGALGIREEDPGPVSEESKQAAVKRLEKIPHVMRAELSSITIGGGTIALLVGIEEKGAPIFQYRPTPNGSVVLPKEMVEAESRLADAWNRMVQTGIGNKEDDSQGHALMENPEVRAGQQKFIELAASGLEILREVLRNSAESRQRAIAA